ncbi:MAG: lipocalin-like domain-containing protein [Bacteroidetes bacterium]|nr:lipocalin-like domain-containing protein [Bacteroidota bacterium]
MKLKLEAVSILFLLLSCSKPAEQQTTIDMEGTWQLISGTVVEKGDTVFTDYTKAHPMIKIINKTHFAFLNHDLKKGKDSTALFVAGGGPYELKGDQYTEHLEYCSAREWEGNDFRFTLKVQNDTLTQSGIEKIEGTEVNRLNIEKYVRVRK